MSTELKGKPLTVSTQTEWSWLQDLSTVGRIATPALDNPTLKQRISSKLNEVNVDPEESADKDAEVSMEDNEMEIGDNEISRDYNEIRKDDSTVSREMGDICSEEETNCSLSLVLVGENGDTPHTGRSRALERDEYGMKEWQTPIEILQDTIDKPLLYDSDSESSSLESPYDDQSPFPSVGLPQMLEFLRERTLATSPVDLKEAYKSHFGSEKGFYKSFFSGPCQFCGKKVLPLPTVHELNVLPNKQVIFHYYYLF